MSNDTPTDRRERTRRRPLWVGLGLLGVVAAVAALVLFQPWKLFTNVEVNEANPLTTAGTTAATGSFTSLAHPTAGMVRIGQSPNGTAVVVLEDLDTDNGPDLELYLSRGGVDGNPTEGGLHLGALKGNKGTQVYEVPAGADLASYNSVVIWCERFSVAFGAAPITSTSAR